MPMISTVGRKSAKNKSSIYNNAYLSYPWRDNNGVSNTNNACVFNKEPG